MTDETKSGTRKAIARLGVVSLTVLTIAGAVGLAGFGAGLIAANAERPAASAEVAPLAVEARPLVRQPSYEVVSRYQGRVEASRSVSLGFELAGTIAAVRVAEGDTVEPGDLVAELDTRTLRADRAAQVAAREALATQLELARLTADRQKALLEREFASTQRHDEARLAVARLEAELRRADAGIEAVDVALSKAAIHAPFAASVGMRWLDDGATASPGQPVVTLFERRKPEFHVGLPEDLASDLAPGESAEVEIASRTYPAKVLRLRPDIDVATRTVPVILALETENELPEGALGTLTLTRSVEGEGAWVPVAALAEGLRGLWTVYLVDERGERPVARREAVSLLHAEEDRAFVGGAFDDAGLVVVSGTHRISDGQPVLVGGGS